MSKRVVFASFSDLLGLDKETALKIGSGFGGGIARKQEVCGVVSGAVMIIGLKSGKIRPDDDVSHEKTYREIDNFCRKFIERNKSINCREILGCDLPTAKERGLFSTVCLKCVKDSAEIIEELLCKREKMLSYKIRKIKSSEIYLLEDFLYEAIFQRDEENLVPKDIINKPELRVFIDGFGKADDYCLVADIDGKVVGAVWSRILSGEVKGFGNVDENTPEFAISLYKEYRNMGIGTALMCRILELLKEHGYKKASLTVQKDNYAVRMYEKVGFKIVKELEEEYLMICELN